MFSSIKFYDLKKNNTIYNIPINKIRPNPNQTRKYFDTKSILELSESIKEYGILQPIIVRIINKLYYEVVSGDRRLKASKIAGFETIPCKIVDINDKKSAIITIIENVQRKNLNFFEEAEGYQNLLSYYNIIEDDLSNELKKNQSFILNKLKLLKLDIEIKQIIIDNNLSEEYALEILKVPDKDIQKRMLNIIIKKDYTIKKAKDFINNELRRIRNNEKLSIFEQNEKVYINDIKVIKNTLNKSLDIIKKSGINLIFNENLINNCYELNIKIKL